MIVRDFLQQLSWTHLANIATGLSGNGAIDPAKVPMLVALVNEGLVDLHARLMLKEGNCIVEMKDNITRYELSSRFAESSYDPLLVPYPYIKDSKEQPFADDVLQIVDVVDQHGQHCPLNYEGHPLAVFVTAAANVLQVPAPRDGVALGISYRAAHDRIPCDSVPDALQADIHLPPQLLPALADFVAARVFRPMHIEHAQQAAMMHMAQYQAQVQALVAADAFSLSHMRTSERFAKNGWV